jgi:biopolymer transport protein ExbD
MAADLNSPQDDSSIISSINVTPFVDVVLVLLVIFMITAPMLVKDILEIKLPKTESGDGQVAQTLGIAINREGNILLQGQLIDDEALKQAVKQALAQSPDAQAIIAADVEVPYGRVVRVIDLLKTSGLNRFAVQIERQDSGSEAGP